MAKNIIALLLMALSVSLSFKHGWDSLQVKDNPAPAKMMSELGISSALVPLLGGITIAIGLLTLFPKTFFLGNLLNALSIVAIMALALQAGNFKIALLEIPFLLLPLGLIYLRYPFQG
ncbi:hypothetical protein MTX78_15015 [Hymenobacter tibetensis]|uniref:DoxX family protein n=1 Tax=Hymenobacter tibetensis TaxID=497967 RepID=A0ABY4CVE5_9BACT|nr:hypothetical protein [Hymenobacter tibetensis]UOG73434.1 hypothetical protein MTX78_15015 [Hymenobacter tibetensis]